MKTRFLLLNFIVGCLLLTSCGNSESAIQTAIAQTEAAMPTETSTPISIETQIPQVSKTATFEPTKTNTPRPTNTPKPTSTIPSDPIAEITQIQNYESSTGTVTFIALVENKGEVPLKFVKMFITLRDANGALMASNHSYSVLDVIQVGTYSPISVNIRDVSGKFSSYDVTLEYREARDISYNSKLEILSHSSTTSSTGTTKIIGEIANNDDVTVEFVKIIAIAYDIDGILVGFNRSYSDFDEISLKGTSPFSIHIRDQGLGALDHYELLFDANEKR